MTATLVQPLTPQPLHDPRTPTASAPKPAQTGAGPSAPSAADPREAIIEHVSVLRAFAISLCRDVTLADDLVQDTLLKAWSKFHLFTPGTNLRAWLFTILRNGFYSGRRKRAREVADSDGTLAGQLACKPEHDGHLALGELAAALGRLPPEQREALILVGAMGFSIEEAAETCGCATGTIKSRANRGRKALAVMLHLDDDEATNMSPDLSEAVLAGLPGSVA
jgi:RNA polymerase sigma-70 factor (ECF subfamily)